MWNIMKNIYGINVTAPLQGALIITIRNLWLKPQAILPNLFEVIKYAMIVQNTRRPVASALCKRTDIHSDLMCRKAAK